MIMGLPRLAWVLEDSDHPCTIWDLLLRKPVSVAHQIKPLPCDSGKLITSCRQRLLVLDKRLDAGVTTLSSTSEEDLPLEDL